MDKEINRVLDEYKTKFKLSNIEEASKDTKNHICFAFSEIYGNVAIKFSSSYWEFIKEAETLKLYKGVSACKLHEVDQSNQVLVLERIVPGYDLHTVKDLKQRIEIFSDLLMRLTTDTENTINISNHKNTLDRAARKANEDLEKYKELSYFINLACELYASISNLNNPQILLHGDLNHRNILKGNENWVAIDPLGLIGDRCFEIPRFVRNELLMQELSDKIKHLDLVLNSLSISLSEDKAILARAFLIEQICTACWQVEINADEHLINEEIQTLKLVTPYVLKMK
ncbi:MAG: aminoglycoside phosphotransferase family protein [Bacilli bacterium]|nr:aminoglycoside phosphotransferase family protein [Bacilli bacterium]MDD4795890.1 aminoglycoside phosphotransferase family protein [Bacilli bacterium]